MSLKLLDSRLRGNDGKGNNQSIPKETLINFLFVIPAQAGTGMTEISIWLECTLGELQPLSWRRTFTLEIQGLA